MTYRDDHQAAIARIAALEHEQRLLIADNERLTGELANAKEWIGGPRKRMALFAGVVTFVSAVGVAMFLCGRAVATPAAPPARPTSPALPQVTGVIVVDRPLVDDWTLTATRCVPYGNGVELSGVGSEESIVWVSPGSVELELPARTIRLDPELCPQMFAISLRPASDGTLAGFVKLACYVDGNRVRGRIDFKHCRE